MVKKFLIVLLFILYFQKYTYVDLSSYQSEIIEIEVKGEVSAPGIYKLPYGSNIKDALVMAKGVLESADINTVNQTKLLKNHDVIVIPKLQSKELLQISINSASMEELMKLPGIGETMAHRIITYRKEYAFQTIEDIMKVKGIKEKLFSKIKPYIIL